MASAHFGRDSSLYLVEGRSALTERSELGVLPGSHLDPAREPKVLREIVVVDSNVPIRGFVEVVIAVRQARSDVQRFQFAFALHFGNPGCFTAGRPCIEHLLVDESQQSQAQPPSNHFRSRVKQKSKRLVRY